MDQFRQDIRFAVRMVWKNPGYAIVAILALGLGIGANTAIFSVADALVWKPIPLPGIQRAVMIQELDARKQANELSPANYLDLREQTRTLEHVAAYEWETLNLTGAGEPERVQGVSVTAAFFDAVESTPQLGRTFLPDEEQPGKDRVVVLSHKLWERRFASDPQIAGKTVELHGRAYSVVGVMPQWFDFPKSAELWVPMAMTPETRRLRGSHYLQVVARLKPGVAFHQAQAEIQTLFARLAQEHRDSNLDRTARVIALREFITGEYTRDYSLLLVGAVLFVLLIVCANVANIQLVQGCRRHREIAVRAAIGASRWGLIRLMLIESLLVSFCGALLGLLFALWSIDVIRGAMPPEVERFIAGWRSMGLDQRALLYTMLVTVACGIVSGIVPAIQFSRPDLNDALKEGGRGATAGRGRHRLRHALVVAEIALSIVLLTGAALLATGFRTLAFEHPNLEPESLLTMRLELPDTKYKDAQVRQFYDRLFERLRSTPGVESAGGITFLPHGSSSSSGSFQIEGAAPLPTGVYRIARRQSANPDYFRAMRIPVIAGRAFDDRDGPDAPRVAVISESLAKRYFPGEDALGKHIRVSQQEPWMTIIGVAGDIRHDTYERDIRPVLYRSYQQATRNRMDVVLRAKGNPKAFIAAARAQVFAIDPKQPVYDIMTMAKMISDERVGLTYVVSIMGVLAVIALVLASVGVFAVMAYSVTERRHEIGVRMALGAFQRDVIGMVLRRGMLLAGTGLVIGLPAAFVVARLVSGLIFGVEPNDAGTFAAVSLLLCGVALLACYIPARRAARVDPLIALRHE